MKKKSLISIPFMCIALGFGVAAAKGKDAPAMAKGNGMTMMDMMGKSNMSCMATHDSLDALSKEVQDAIKSDDKAKMKAALQKTDAHFAQMKSHMSMCMDMMNMMGGMMGGNMMGGKPEGGMGMVGKAAEEAKPIAPDKEKDKGEDHEKHHPK